MNRTDLQEIALLRLEEAKILLASDRYSGAYYLSGYVIECALKACIARQVQQYDFPDKNMVNASYTHDLSKLMRTAGLENALDQYCKQNPDFELNWNVVQE
jgi:HEPN domain-containing protein